jgi:hypothetical protein
MGPPVLASPVSLRAAAGATSPTVAPAEAATVRTASNSVAVINPLSRSRAARRSRRSAGLPPVLTARPSSGVNTPFVTSTRINGSALTGSAAEVPAWAGLNGVPDFSTEAAVGAPFSDERATFGPSGCAAWRSA